MELEESQMFLTAEGCILLLFYKSLKQKFQYCLKLVFPMNEITRYLQPANF